MPTQFCPQCGYNLTSNPFGRCPECGRHCTYFELRLLHFDLETSSGFDRLWLWCAPLLAIVWFLAASAITVICGGEAFLLLAIVTPMGLFLAGRDLVVVRRSCWRRSLRQAQRRHEMRLPTRRKVGLVWVMVLFGQSAVIAATVMGVVIASEGSSLQHIFLL